MQLDDGILESTLWGLDPATKVVWITMLRMADELGRVQASIPGLAHRAHVSLEETTKALSIFSSPDPYSRTQTYDGRRIMAIEGGWALINFAKYQGPMRGVTVVNPDKGNVVPSSWKPNDSHKGRCAEFFLDLATLETEFRAHEFNRDYGDWNRCFDRWIMQAHVKRGVRPPVKGQPANDTPSWKPNDAHRRYCEKFSITRDDLTAAATKWISDGQPQLYMPKERDSVFGRVLANLARAKHRKAEDAA